MSSQRLVAPKVSIVLATRDRKEHLGNFIAALRRLPDEPSWEVVVADNGSTDGTAELLASASEDLPMTVVVEESPGKSRALNKALAAGRGELLLFTDDDVVPEPQWLETLYDASRAFPEVNVFGGKVVVRPECIPRWLARSYNLKTMLVSEQNLGGAICRFEVGQYPVGPNMAVRKRVLASKAVCWPVNLGPGTSLPLGDERAFLMSISAPHLRDRLYVPGSIVLHDVNGSRLSVRSAVIRCFMGGFSAGLANRAYGTPRARPKDKAWRLALLRVRQSASVPELVCVVFRAVGMIAGSLSPYPRLCEPGLPKV